MANLIVLQGPDRGRTFQTGAETVLLGRDSDEITLTDQTVSRRHCELRPDNGAWILRDMQSANGTYVNGVRVHQQVRLKHGDQIKLGATLMVYSGDESVAKLSGPRTRGLIDLDVAPNLLDSSIQVRVPSSEDSVIIDSPQGATDYVVQVRCSSDPTGSDHSCDSSKLTVNIGVTCPASGSLGFGNP